MTAWRLLRGVLLGVLLWCAGASARAESDFSIPTPPYIAAAADKLSAELTKRSLPVPSRPACTGFSGLDPADREYMVICVLTAPCWKSSIGSVERRLQLYGVTGALTAGCTAAELDAVQAATVDSFLSCANPSGRQEAVKRLLQEPLDVSNDEKSAEYDRRSAADPNYSKRFQIHDVCEWMVGFRSITNKDGIRHDDLTLSYLKPEFAPP